MLIWNVRPRPRFTRADCARRVTSSPPRKTCPVVGSSRPVSMLMKVVLPAPFGPISACRAPVLEPELDVVRDRQRAEALAQRAGLEGDAHVFLQSFSRARSIRPSSPPRANITMKISSTPIPSVQYSGDCFAR